MSRLGELLVASGLVTPAALTEALHTQVMWGGRLGTNLVELDHIALDPLSQVLGRQHNMPAALGKHFDRADPTLQTLLSPNLAESYACVPLVRVGKRVVVASMAPLAPRATAIVADELAVDPEWIIAAVAPELRIRYFLERVYKIPRMQRFLRVRGGARSEPAMFPASPEEVEPAALAPAPIGVEPALELPPLPEPLPDPPEAVVEAVVDGLERRHYIQTLADVLETHPDKDSIVAALDRLDGADTPPSQAEPPTRPSTDAELAEIVGAIERGRDRDAVAQLVMDAVAQLEPSVPSAMLLVVRGTVAATWTSFARDGSTLQPIAVPLDHPGLVALVMKRKLMRRGTAADLSAVDYLLIASLGVEYGDLIVAPIAVAGQVAAMMVLAVPHALQVTCAESIVTAAGAAFERLMREATRRRT